MHTIANRYKRCFTEKGFIFSCIVTAIFLVISLIVNYHAGIFATEEASNPVTDLILSNIPVFELDGTFVWGTILFWIFTIYIILHEPKRIPFTFNSISLFVLTRSLFISLTHIGPFPSHVAIDSGLISKFTFGGDLFFSGHVGLPFLLALIFWDIKRLRFSFLLWSFGFACVVLMAHLHYSIDVISAYFITYTIYHMASKLFRRDRGYFELLSEEREPVML